MEVFLNFASFSFEYELLLGFLRYSDKQQPQDIPGNYREAHFH